MRSFGFTRAAACGAVAFLASSVLATARGDEGVIESWIARAAPANPRHTEADVLVRRDGSLLVAWSDFYQGARDDAPARISSAVSRDGGRTWGPRSTLEENTGRENVMSVSFLRSRSGDVLFFFLRKNSTRDLKVYMRRSSDDAASWSEPVTVTTDAGYHVMNNARVIQLRSGRLLAPVASTAQVWTKNDDFRTSVWMSDDDGRTWRRSRSQLSAPKRGAMEPGLVELRDGRVMQIIRTQTGRIWRSFSADGGDTWTDAMAWDIEAPEAPSTLVATKDGGEWLLVWNPNVSWGDAARTVLGANHGGPRTPLAAMVSPDEGRTWGPRRMLETDPAATYAYTSVTFHEGRALLTYYHFPNGGKELSLKFKSVPFAWFRAAP
jgi:sialidase-1